MASPAPPPHEHEPLDISDLIRPSFSPSPKPISRSSRHATPVSPGPFEPGELEAMKEAVVAMNIVPADSGPAVSEIPPRAETDAGPPELKEKQLARMVGPSTTYCRLISSK